MSFPIILYRNNTSPSHMTKDITEIATATGTLRSPSSIISPSIIIESALAAQLIAQINYMYIAQFSRYYFINNIESVNNSLWLLNAHVDVLMSWRDSILANTAIVSRQENNWNIYLDDGQFKAYQDPLVQTKVFPNGFTSFEFVLAVAGSQRQGLIGGTTESVGDSSETS